MKKIIMTTVVTLAAIGTASMGFAATYSEMVFTQNHKIVGAVESVNKGNNTFVVKDNEGGLAYYVLGAWSQDIAQLSPGDIVRATVPCNTNLAYNLAK